MNDKMRLLQEIYDLSGGYNLGELLAIYESNHKYRMELKYKNIYKSDNIIIVEVIDKITECPFELYFCEEEKKLKILES